MCLFRVYLLLFYLPIYGRFVLLIINHPASLKSITQDLGVLICRFRTVVFARVFVSLCAYHVLRMIGSEAFFLLEY